MSLVVDPVTGEDIEEDVLLVDPLTGEDIEQPIQDSQPQHSRSNLFPSRTALDAEAEATGKPVGAVRGALSTVTDALDAPSRFIAQTRGMDMSDPNAYLLAPEVEESRQRREAGRTNFITRPGETPQQIYERMRKEGAPLAPEALAAPVTEVVGRTMSDPLNFVGGGLIKGAAKLAGIGAGKAAGAINRGSGRLAQELSGVSEEALRMGSTKAGRQALRQASGKQAEIGKKLSDAVNDYHDYLPEKEIVENALKNMPPVDIGETIKTLEAAKVSPYGGISLLPHQARANAEIDAIISGLRGDGGKTVMSAEDAYKVRRALDYSLDFDKAETKTVDAALKKARKQLKNDLLASAGKSGNVEYAKAMKDWARKLNTLDKITSRLGATRNTREARSEAFVNSLFGKNSHQKQELMKDLDEVFGTNLLQESKMTFLADEIGEGGKAAWLPKQSGTKALIGTGAGAIAGAVGAGGPGAALVAGTLAAHSSPAVASKFILPGTQFVEDAISKGLLKSPKAKALANAYKRTGSAALKARIANQLQKELEKGENK